MAVILTSPVEGLQPGAEYTGPNELFHIQNGYAKPKTGTVPNERPLDPYVHVAGNPLNGDWTDTTDAELPPAAPETYAGYETQPVPPVIAVGHIAGGTEDATLPPIAPETLLGQEHPYGSLYPGAGVFPSATTFPGGAS